ncbi:MAG: hypothetical protein ACM3UT_08300 [Chloroflexota bacterium]
MKKFLLWFTAFVLTIGAAIYQRHTGPTYPKETKITLNGKEYELHLVRSLSLDRPAEVELAIPDPSVKARLFFKRFNTKEDYQVTEFTFRNEPGKEAFFAEVPKQPAAGKIQYYIEVTDSSSSQTILKEEPVVIRFKGGVPAWILVPHIILMFLAMLFSNLAGVMSLIRYPQYKKYGVWTLVLLIIGGMILGPLVQYYAFGELWTGVPFGWDLTDNKTLIAVIFWIFAVYMNRKQDRPVYTALAAFVLLLVYSIPHSLFGSELDYSSGEITQG